MIQRILALLMMWLAASAFAAVDVNSATVADLDAVKGIGPALSQRIIDERKNGKYKDWADFVERVKGVGEGSAAKMSAAGLTVNGATFKAMAAAAPAAAPAAKPAKPEAKAAAAPAAPPPAAAKAADKPMAAASAAAAKK